MVSLHISRPIQLKDDVAQGHAEIFMTVEGQRQMVVEALSVRGAKDLIHGLQKAIAAVEGIDK